MRGKGIPYSTAQKWSRITPAYAGKSRSQHLPPSLSWDHPRLCGEKFAPSSLSQVLPGSPPPMRGKVFSVCIVITSARITPAYAGKSSQQGTDRGQLQDHPRLCGEKIQIHAVGQPHTGSPPPMRGKADLGVSATATGGITPAYAGKS